MRFMFHLAKHEKNHLHPLENKKKKTLLDFETPYEDSQTKKGETIPSNCKCGYPRFNRNNSSILHPGFEGNCHTIGS